MDLFEDLPEAAKAVRVPLPPRSLSVVKDGARRTPAFLLPSLRNDLFGDLPPSTKPNDEQPANSRDDSLGKGVKRKAVEVDSNSDRPTEKEDHKSNTPSEGLFVVHGFAAERKGEREEMQDTHLTFDHFHKDVPGLHPSISRLALYGVFDGHGGMRASKFAASSLPKVLTAKFPKGDLQQVEKEIKKCLVDSFKKTDEAFLKEAKRSKPSWKDGTTAITVLVINNAVYIANLGDSKAILCRYNESSQKYTAIPLSKDHAPTDYNERMRIQKAGGHVRDGRVMGVLEVSRSIGDGQFKTCGVVAVPDVRRCQLTENDRFILLACDGLWKVFTSDDVIKIVMEALEECTSQGESRKSVEVQLESVCNRLVNEAVRKLSGDNVTLVFISIQNPELR